jgi:type IV secretion system protein VirB9
MGIKKKTANIIKCLGLVLLFTLVNFNAYATSKPRPMGGDSRIKIISYTPNTVFQYVGHYEYQSIIEFGQDETIQTITMGTPSPWQLIPAGNRIFLKPIDDDASTNMTVITDKRMYFFEMSATEATSITDSNLSFIMKFVYPEQYQAQAAAIQQPNTTSGPDLSHPELFNFNYSISGPGKEIEPLQVFDDAEIPAIFKVNSDGTEALVNFRFQGGFAIVEMVTGRYTLRHGSSVICIFNNKSDLTYKKVNPKVF